MATRNFFKPKNYRDFIQRVTNPIYPKEDLGFGRQPQDVFEPNPLKRRLERRPPSKEFDEIMKKIEKEEREKAMAKRDYKSIITKIAMNRKALLGYEAGLWDLLEKNATDEQMKSYIVKYLPKYQKMLSTRGLNAVLEAVQAEDLPIQKEFDEAQGKRGVSKPVTDRNDVESFTPPMKSPYLANQDLMKRLMTVSQVEADPEDDMMYDPDERAWIERESNPGMSDEYKPSWEPKKKIRPHKKQFGVNNESPNRPR